MTIPAATYGLADADWTADLIESDATGSRFVAPHAGAAVPVRVDAPGRSTWPTPSVRLRCSPRQVSTWRTQRGRSPPSRCAGPHGGGPAQDGPDSTPDVVVVVDYAHTPDAVQGALLTMRALTQGKIWCVLGCGGDRDAIKRPAMGRIAAENSDHLVVTDDNPRTEDPAVIRAGAGGGPRGRCGQRS